MAEYIDREAALNINFKVEIWRCSDSIEVVRQAAQCFADAIKAIPAADVRPVVLCRDCYWWTKQAQSLQGRCALLGISPTGAWFCANGQKKSTGDPHVCGKCGKSSDIVCLVDGFPYCERCLSLALGVEPSEEDEK